MLVFGVNFPQEGNSKVSIDALISEKPLLRFCNDVLQILGECSQ